MEAQDVIASLHRSGAVLDLVDGELRCRAPKGVLTRELVEQLKTHKQQIQHIVAQSREGAQAEGQAAAVQRYPLTSAQRRLWFLEQLIGASPTYNTFGVFKVTGALRVESLRRSLAKLMRRHAVLSVYIAPDEGEPVQVPRPDLVIDVPLVEAASMTEPEREQFVRQEGRRPFDLARDCLIRVVVMRQAPDSHLLLLNMHHIIADGWSMAVFVNELAAFYNADLSGEPAILPVLTRQYFDYALEERTAQWEESIVRHTDYWRERLARLPPALELGAGRARPGVQTYDGAFETFSLDAAFARALAQFCATKHVTANSVLLAAFKVLLARYSGQRDIVVGTIVAQRNASEVEKLIGLFANTLAIRCDVAGEKTFSQLVDDVQRATTEAHEHERAPFERVVQALGIERDLAVAPVFQVLFLMQSIPGEAAPLGGLIIEPVEHDNAVAKYDLTLSVTQLASGFRCGFQYRLDLFDAALIRQLIASYRSLLHAALARPDTAVSRLPIIAHTEHASSIRAVADRSFEHTGGLHAIFERQCASSPDSVAIEWEGGCVTYHEVNARANRVAHGLLRLGLGAESRIGLCMQPMPDMIVGVLAILKVGACYVPLDPGYPVERLAFIASDAGVEVVLTAAAHRDAIRAALPMTTHVVDVGEFKDEPATNPARCVSPQQAAYVIYTSGSTGRPKGVVVTHANVARLLSTTAGMFDFRPQDVWTLFHSFAFDFSVWEIWGAFAHGAAVSIVPYAIRHDPPAFLDWLESHRVTVLSQTPTAFARVFAAMEKDTAARSLSLRYVVFGGESLNPRSAARWAKALAPDGTTLINMYGITETTVHVTFAEVSPHADSFDDIGRPLADLDVHVLDEQLQPVPLTARGEIYVSGPGLARGYLGRPDLTAQRLVPNPFATQPGERMYRSGDCGRLHLDGRLEYLGRLDRQVNVRGYRIELGEIESCLRDHADVHDAVVIQTCTDAGEAQLTGYIVPRVGRVPDAAEIYENLRGRLPSYMLPAQLRQVQFIPTTANGKVDQAALRQMDMPAPLRSTQVAPRDATEEALVRLFRETLGQERLGVHDNFFALGGDSITSIRVIAEAHRRALPLELPDLFRYQTPAALSTVIRTRQLQQPSERTRAFELVSEQDRAALPTGIEDAYPLTALQAGMLFHSERDPAQEYYHNVSCLRLRGVIEPEAFAAAVRAAVARHPVLRTSVWRGGSEPLQLVHPAVELPVTFVDWSGLGEADRVLAVEGMIEQQRRQTFDVDRAPLFRLLVHRVAIDECWLTWVEHHMILDGWSVATLFAEIFEDYFNRNAGERRAPLQTSFRDYIAAERLAAQSSASRDFWREHLAELSPAPLPPKMTLDAKIGVGTQDVPAPIVISRDVTQKLRQCALEFAVPLKSLLLSVHVAVISHITGARDVVTGIVTNGRLETQDGEGVLGLYLNTVPFGARLSHDGAQSWHELILSTVATELEVLPHRRFPMTAIRALQGDATLFDTAFNYMNFHVLNRLRGKDDELEVLEARNFQRNSIALMSNWRDDTGGDLTLTLSYDSARLSMQQVSRFREYYVRALTALAEDSRSRVVSTDLLAPFEHDFLRDWNATMRASAGPRLVHERIELHAKQSPLQTALWFAEERLTYGELNARANRLAQRLVELAVPCEGRVGVCIDRSFELVIACVAVLKAGAAIVFLEPEQPLERLRSLVRDAKLHAIVVDVAREAVGEGAGVPVLTADDTALGASGANNPPRAVHPDNLAYVVYTSGTTGRPKGAMNSHAGLCNQIDWMQSEYRLYADDVVLQKTPISFDVSVWELLWPLCAGAQLALARPGGHRDPPYLLQALRKHAVTVCHFVPSMLRLFLDALHGEHLPQRLRLVICSGEALSESVRRDLYAVVPEQTRLHNLYGPAEASIDSSYWACPRDTAQPTRIGKPVHNTQLYVVQPSGQLAPVGTPGELYIGGAGLGRGYLHRPDLTAERFVPHPWSEEPGARLYRTGDRVRHAENGELEYLGRLDNQVKIAGCRIEPEEIERTLAALPAVRAAAVVIRRAQPEQTDLIAFVVMDRDAVFSDQDLHRALRALLPSYMCPSTIIAVEQLPAGANGKVDRRALQQLATSPMPARQQRPPQGRTERSVARIWSSVLGGAEVDLDTHFFTSGGNSLRAMQAIAAVRNELGVEVPIARLFEMPVLGDFALETLRLRLQAADSEAGFMEIASHEGDARLEAIYQSMARA